MGELHLEITLDRLKTQYKVDTDMGKLQVMSVPVFRWRVFLIGAVFEISFFEL